MNVEKLICLETWRLGGWQGEMIRGLEARMLIDGNNKRLGGCNAGRVVGCESGRLGGWDSGRLRCLEAWRLPEEFL